MRRAAILIVPAILAIALQGCFLFGVHDDRGYHRQFAYETPERTSGGHAHYERASW